MAEITIKYSADVSEVKEKIDELIKALEVLEAKAKSLGIKLTVDTSQSDANLL